jgi:succinyl-CoA synthetase alpha subunit
MSILIDEKTRVIVYGLGKQGSFHARLMKEYGTNIVGIVSRSSETEFEGIPILKSVKDVKADWGVIFVPADYAKLASIEALDSGLNLVIITEGMKVHEVLDIMQKAKEKGLVVIGPNCPGLISPGKSKIGIMPAHIFRKGDVGLVSRSGTLTYEIVNELSRAGIGQSTVVGIGGDMVIGSSFVDVLRLMEADKETKKIVVVGEIGGSLEEEAADYIKNHVSKRVVAYIAGVSAPREKRMGHAGAIIEGNKGTAESKIKAFEAAGVKVAKLPSEIVGFLK